MLSLVMFCQVVLSDCWELIWKVSFKPVNFLHSMYVLLVDFFFELYVYVCFLHKYSFDQIMNS